MLQTVDAKRLFLPVIAVVIAAGMAVALAATAFGAETSSQVNTGSDDAYEGADNFPSYSHTDVVIYSGYPNAGGNQATIGGWRFTGLGLPACATITHAHAEISAAYEGYTTTTTLAFEDNGAPATFSPENTPMDRWLNRTSFTTVWTTGNSGVVEWVSTPDLAAGVQELIDSYGDIDAIVLLENGAGNDAGVWHSWLAFEKDPALAAKLFIGYECEEDEPEPTPSPTPTPKPHDKDKDKDHGKDGKGHDRDHGKGKDGKGGKDGKDRDDDRDNGKNGKDRNGDKSKGKGDKDAKGGKDAKDRGDDRDNGKNGKDRDDDKSKGKDDKDAKGGKDGKDRGDDRDNGKNSKGRDDDKSKGKDDKDAKGGKDEKGHDDKSKDKDSDKGKSDKDNGKSKDKGSDKDSKGKK